VSQRKARWLLGRIDDLILSEESAVRLRIGTVVPRGSLWFDTLQYIAQNWQRIVGPGLKVVIHPDRVTASVVRSLPCCPPRVDSITTRRQHVCRSGE
jgi:hypothetical protein